MQCVDIVDRADHVVMKKSYSELIRLPSIEERIEYLMMYGRVGSETFGFDRYVNQRFYRSTQWRNLRHKIIVRDNGCDLAVDGFPVGTRGAIHHINPLSLDDLMSGSESIFDPENLVLCSLQTHNTIHYGWGHPQGYTLCERKPNDQCPWK